jgi:ribosomal protein L16 Arg81 hydroxylase
MQMPVLPLEDRTALDPEEFFQSFLLQNRPVIIRGAIAHWPAVQKWSPEYLRTMVEGAKVVIQSKSDYGASGSKRHFEESKETDFAEVVDMMTLNDAPDMSYVRQTRVWKEIEPLVADVQPLRYGPANLAKTDGNLWIGPAGTIAQMHWDPGHNLFAQIRGEKKWILVPPSESHMTYANKFSLSEITQDSGIRERFPAFVENMEKAMASSASVENLVDNGFNDAERRLVYSWLAQMNNCDVNAEDPDPEKTPLFLTAHRHEGMLKAGDLMFIPIGWRHFVRSMSASISMNWFFVPQQTLPPELNISRTLLEHLVYAA